ncbi:MAG: tetratricopeptide repeat protein [Rhodospirillales bacterium]|nr:tetratricopeptide repeat protein [Rhodospirillales bacterium]
MASPQSDAAILAGIAKAEKQDYAGALKDFQAAQAADPVDGRAVFYQGYALSRLGKLPEALKAFEDFRARRMTHRELDFEEGWALLLAGRPGPASERLARYERANPAKARASEMLGRAYLAEGRLDEAEAAFKRAMAGDPGLVPASLYSLSQLESRRGNARQAQYYADRLLRDHPEAPAAKLLRAAQAAARPDAADKAWSAYGAAALGFSDNAYGFSDDVARPTDIKHIESFFTQVDVGGEYRFAPTAIDHFAIGFGVTYAEYFDIGALDFLNNSVYGRYQRRLNPWLGATLQLGGTYALVDGERLRSGFTVQPTLTIRPIEGLGVDVYYEYGLYDYRGPSQNPRDLDRDADHHTTGARASLAVAPLNTTFHLGAAGLYNDSEGTDFRYRAAEIMAGATVKLPWRVEADLQAKYGWYDYWKPNSLTAPTAYENKRFDDVAQFKVGLSRPIYGPASGFVQYLYTDSDSNLPVFRYTQHDARMGVLARF